MSEDKPVKVFLTVLFVVAASMTYWIALAVWNNGFGDAVFAGIAHVVSHPTQAAVWLVIVILVAVRTWKQH